MAKRAALRQKRMMPHYFFHVQNQTSYTRDETGVELQDLAGARRQAADAAGEILTSDLEGGRNDVRFEIHVEDFDDRRLMTLYLTGTIKEPVSPPSDQGADSAD